MEPMIIQLNLKEGKKPHLYISEIRDLMKDNKTLHPQMKATLTLLKRRRMPFVQLATKKQIIFDFDNFCHFEQSLAPQKLGWSKTYWSKEERDNCKEDAREYMKNVLDGFTKMGYEFFNVRKAENDILTFARKATAQFKPPKEIEEENDGY